LQLCCLWIRNRDRRENEERIINVSETWSWRGMLKIEWTDRITNDEVFQRAKEDFLKFYKMDSIHGLGIKLGITSLW